MSGAPTGGPDQSFNERLNRVAEVRAPIEANKQHVELLPDWKSNFRYPASLVAATCFGMISVFIARCARYHLTGGSLVGNEADITMVIDGGIAVAVSFMLFTLLRFEGHDYKMAQTVGIVAMVCIMHNFVHMAPKAFDVVFSPEWTADVMAYTEPKSILFRGITFALDPTTETAGTSESAPAMPNIIRLQ